MVAAQPDFYIVQEDIFQAVVHGIEENSLFCVNNPRNSITSLRIRPEETRYFFARDLTIDGRGRLAKRLSRMSNPQGVVE